MRRPRLLDRLPWRPRSQAAWERIRDEALRGMNYGNDDPETNGEVWLLRYVAKVLGPRPLVFDVGANTGTYAATALAALPEATIHCFEPSAAAYARLWERLGSEDRVELHQLGLGRSEEQLTLYANAPGSALASLYPRRLDHHGIELAPIEEVAIARLDLFCRREGIESIDFLKVDAEGHELAVLEGAGAMLDGVQIAALQFELGGTALDARVYLRDFFDLLSRHYTLHRLLPDGLSPIAEYGEQHEVFAYANYVCLSRSTPFASSSER